MDTPTKFAEAAGISIPYASQLLAGKRTPSQALAIQIFRRTGRKFDPIANYSDETIAEIERSLPDQDEAA